ncbi:MAG: hypothetical protein HC808_00190 [Candidatus Competibacteraceae bacterium]|nr:hypothetical protein [Candidatus Competibacteraceae bacterium]
MLNRVGKKLVWQKSLWNLLKACNFIFIITVCLMTIAKADNGLSDTVIRIGSTQPLKGDLSPIGQGMKLGMETASKMPKSRGAKSNWSCSMIPITPQPPLK